MAKFNSIQNSFVSGMISKKFNGATDLSIYKEAVEELINMVPTSEGGARTREAFENAILFSSAEPPTNETPSRCTLIPYIDSIGVSYIFRITQYLDDTPGSIDIQVWKFNPNTGTWDVASFTNKITTSNWVGTFFDWVYIGDSIVITTGYTRPWIIHRPQGGSQDFTISFLDNLVLDSQPAAPVTDLNKAMIAMNYPSGIKNTNGNYLLVATATTGIKYNLSFKNAAGTENATAWTDGLITYITTTNSGNTTVFRTTGVRSGATNQLMEAELVYKKVAPAAPLTTTGEKDWYISPWDNINGYPKYCTFSNGRLVLAGTNKFPSKVWLSKVDTIYRFHDLKFTEDASADVSGLGTNLDAGDDSSPFSILSGGNTSSRISWVTSGPHGFYIGSFSGVELITSGNNGTFSSSNNFSTTLTNEGASEVNPVVVSGAIVYVATDGKRVIMLTADGKTTDLTSLFNDYIYAGTVYGYSDYIRRIVANESQGTIYILTLNGGMYGFRLNTLQGKWGIFVIEAPHFRETACVPYMDICLSYEFKVPKLFLNAYYTKTDNSKYYNIFRQRSYQDYAEKSRDTAVLDVFQANGFITGKVMTLPTFLRKGRYTLGVYYQANDGKFYSETFATGYTDTVTLARDADINANAACGFVFTQKIKSLDLDVGGSSGNTGLTLMKRIDELNLKVWNSERFYFGVDGQDLEEVVLSPASDTILYTGAVSKKLQSSPERETHVIITVTTPTPLYVSALIYRGLAMEG